MEVKQLKSLFLQVLKSVSHVGLIVLMTGVGRAQLPLEAQERIHLLAFAGFQRGAHVP